MLTKRLVAFAVARALVALLLLLGIGIAPSGAAELSSSSWSETASSNTTAVPDGWPSGMAPNQVRPTAQEMMAALKRAWDRINGTITSAGSANAYTYTPVNTNYPTSYGTGETYTFKANFANTSTATLNVNGLGAKNLFKMTSGGPAALGGGEIQIGQMVTAVYDGTQFQITSALSAPLSAQVVSFTRDVSLATGTQAVTGVGFKPSACIFFAGIVGQPGQSLGVAGPVGTNGLIALATNETTLAQTNAILFSDSGGTVAYAGTTQSFDADGFTISWVKTSTPTGTMTVKALCLR